MYNMQIDLSYCHFLYLLWFDFYLSSFAAFRIFILKNPNWYFFLQILTSVKEIMVVLRRRSVWTPSAPTAASVCLGTEETGSIVKASDYQSKPPVTFLIPLPSVTRDNIKYSFILYYLRCRWMFQGGAKLLWQACLLHEYGRLLLLHLSKGLLWKRILLSW